MVLDGDGGLDAGRRLLSWVFSCLTFFLLQDTRACIIIVNKIEREVEASTGLKAVFSFQGEIHCFPRPQRPAL